MNLNLGECVGVLVQYASEIAMEQRDEFIAETQRQDAEREKEKNRHGVRAQSGARNDAGLDGHGQARDRALLRGHPTPSPSERHR